MNASFLTADALRAKFAAALSVMYRAESPQYRALSDLVARINRHTLAADHELARKLVDAGEIERLEVERHGAIRLGSAQELATLRRLFAVLGLAPVGYYDLSSAGIPVHSTAFRPIGREALRASPFRIFTSLLRLDLIEERELKREAAATLAARNIFTPHLLRLLKQAEEAGGLDAAQADGFVVEAVRIFHWRGEARVSAQNYRKFASAHPLLADILCFDTPHINHLTLATLDIDAVHATMATSETLTPKAIVEGPPGRRCPILLRQTSFKAVPEPVRFKDETGVHTARFGEVEQRGVALTAKGRSLYDRCLAEANAFPLGADGENAGEYMTRLRTCFAAFPDDVETLRAERLAFFRYVVEPDGAQKLKGASPPFTMEALLRARCVRLEPITYEDFLPVSAAGIFRSNLSQAGQKQMSGGADRRAFETALGAAVLDELALYEEEQAVSRTAALDALGLPQSLSEEDR